jgi:RNA polymerase sigma factor (sigma-70 family)
MDFQKLKDHDREEWGSILTLLFGIGVAAAGRFSGLSAEDREDAASYAIETADARIGDIKPAESSLKAFVRTVAHKKAHEMWAKRARKPEGHSESLEQKIEEVGEPKELSSEDNQPDNLLKRAERTALFYGLLKQLKADDLDLLWKLEVEEVQQKVVAEENGRGEKSIGGWKRQACARLAKVLRSDPRAVQLLKELELDHYIE